ncbi:tyrosine-type recombinase/integrase [Alteromonas australica]|uniref:tyrosine-type recombinase/integrase n=1 Tax=Alteromonas australica TaxID=589873 RepID=UPI0009DCD3A8
MNVYPSVVRNWKPLFGYTLFLSNSGNPFRPTQLSELIKKYLKSAGFDVNAACNMFRHSAATHMPSNGANLRQIQDLQTFLLRTYTRIFCRVSRMSRTYGFIRPRGDIFSIFRIT